MDLRPESRMTADSVYQPTFVTDDGSQTTTGVTYPVSSDNYWPSTQTFSQIPTTDVQPATTSTSTENITVSSATASATASETSSGNGGGEGDNKTIAIAVPISVVGGVILLVALFFLLRRRRQHRRGVHSSFQVDMGQVTTPDPQPQNESSSLGGRQSRLYDNVAPFGGPIHREPVSENNQASARQSRFYALNPAQASQSAATVAAQAVTTVPDRSEPVRGEDQTETERNTTAAGLHESNEEPKSPFRHPDDTRSEISRMSYMDAGTHTREIDDVSSVSSFDDDDEQGRHV